MNKKISIILSILLIIVLTTIAYGWMQTQPSTGELVEYNRRFYITDSDIQVKLYALVNGTYVQQGQFSTDPLIELEEMYPGKIQRYRFELSNANSVPSRVKIVFTELTGDISVIKPYLRVNLTNPDVDSFLLDSRLEQSSNNDRYYFGFAESVTIPANSSINYYWNFEIDIDAPNALQGKSFEVNRIMFIKPM